MTSTFVISLLIFTPLQLSSSSPLPLAVESCQLENMDILPVRYIQGLTCLAVGVNMINWFEQNACTVRCAYAMQWLLF